MKIKKNLSDEDMFRGMQETESFETLVLQDDRSPVKRRGFAGSGTQDEKVLLLPLEIQEKLNRCLLEASMEWLKAKGGDMEWKVIREGTEITLKPVAKKKGKP